VTLFDADSVTASLGLAAELRAAGYRVDVYPEPDKLGKQFKYAAAIGVPRVAVLGSDERARGVVTVKEMASGLQQQIPRGELAASLRAWDESEPRAPSASTTNATSNEPRARNDE
jgi:histidyl-tRNA synthetase